MTAYSSARLSATWSPDAAPLRAGRVQHIAEPAEKVFLDTCHRLILHQIEKLTNPTSSGSARIEVQEYLAAIHVAYEEMAGHPWTRRAAA